MPSNKVKLGTLIEPVENRNSNEQYSLEYVRGIATSKIFIDTKANMDGVPLTSYKIVEPDMFAFVSDTSRRGDKISLAYNDSEIPYLVSSISTVFQISNKNELLSDFLFIYFNRPEFDRYTRFNSWGSARETFSWEDMCDIDIELPPLPIQQKYVDIYKAMVENQQTYERGLEDLKLVCDAYIEDLRRKMPCEEIGRYIQEIDNKNTDLELGLENVRGISIDKKFIPTKANMDGVPLKGYKIVAPKHFAYVPVTSRNGDKISFAHNYSNDPYLVSSTYTTFYCYNSEKLLPEYLCIFFNKNIFDEYARYNSWGSAREIFLLEDLKKYKIPIPDTKIQQSIVNIYNAYNQRKEINEKLKAQIKEICPILIKGSIEEAKRTVEV